jgi:hypothetical protein
VVSSGLWLGTGGDPLSSCLLWVDVVASMDRERCRDVMCCPVVVGLEFSNSGQILESSSSW